MLSIDVKEEVLSKMRTNEGDSLVNISLEKPVLLVFLRHFGCTFCREALADISNRRKEIERSGTKIVFVHMTNKEVAEKYFDKYQLSGVTHISDPQCLYYKAFGLLKGNFTQLFGLQSWIRGFNAGIVQRHGIGMMLGDGFQMPGVFMIQNGEVKEGFIHKLASDRPDYIQLVNCCTPRA